VTVNGTDVKPVYWSAKYVKDEVPLLPIRVQVTFCVGARVVTAQPSVLNLVFASTITISTAVEGPATAVISGGRGP